METVGRKYSSPKVGGNVNPEDVCTAYTPRQGSFECLKQCWYCRYADFHLKEEQALEIGFCRWPKKIIE